MLPYIAPQTDMLLSLLHIAGGRDLLAASPSSVDEDTLAALLGEAARLAETDLAPRLRDSDLSPPTLNDKGVTVGPDMHQAHRLVSENGWIALPYPEAVGGLNQPWAISSLMLELADSANVAFALSMCMTQGCAEAILAHGSQAQIDAYVPALINGTYMGTMQLTEASAGSDVGALTTQATPAEDGSWRLSGTKIYISWGDSDLADNIVHMVLARTPSARAEARMGTKGLSLFLVPKILPDGTRNSVYPSGLEHKLGLHGSPTCTMVHEGSVGWLVGQEQGGMAAMFTMMNNARIGVGFQGLGVSERALQAAQDYAKARVQGGSAIVHYPDVQRNLGIMKCLTAASRDLGYSAHVAGDLARLGGDGAARHQRRIDLLTPIAKAFMTDAAVEVTNLAIQIHGGMGVIEETGVAQLARDCRVFTIYEGTNGIQALDLAGRKTLRDQGQGVKELLADMQATLDEADLRDADLEEAFSGEDSSGEAPSQTAPGLAALTVPLKKAHGDVSAAVDWLLVAAAHDPNILAAAATPYLHALAYLSAGWGMLKRAMVTQARQGTDPDLARAQRHLALFYTTQLLPRVDAALVAMRAGSPVLLTMDREQI